VSTSRPGRFNRGKEPWYPLNRRLGGTLGSLWAFWGTQVLLAPAGTETPDHLGSSLVAIPTMSPPPTADPTPQNVRPKSLNTNSYPVDGHRHDVRNVDFDSEATRLVASKVVAILLRRGASRTQPVSKL